MKNLHTGRIFLLIVYSEKNPGKFTFWGRGKTNVVGEEGSLYETFELNRICSDDVGRCTRCTVFFTLSNCAAIKAAEWSKI